MPGVQHMVIVKFKPEVAAETIEQLWGRLAELPALIPGITHFSGGPYASGEGLHRGFTHGFLMTFESVAARDAYLPHPEHERVKEAILPYVEDVIAFDYEL